MTIFCRGRIIGIEWKTLRVLILVTFGHLLADPLYEFHTHVIPRTALLLFVLAMPASEDRMSVDYWLARKKS